MPNAYKADEIQFDESPSYTADQIVFDDEPEIKPRPSLGYRFMAGLAQKEIEQPAGFEAGDIAEFVGREGLPAITGALGVGAGPAGAAAGSALGRTVQKGLQPLVAEIYPELKNQETTLESVGDIALTGATSGAFEAAGRVAGPFIKSAVQKVGKAARGLGAQMLRAGPGIPEKYGRAVLADPDILARAPSPEAVSNAYAAFERSAGLKSLRNASADRGQIILKPGEAEGIINSAFQKLQTGTLSNQEAYEASQAASFLKNQARFGNTDQLANLSNLNRAKQGFDYLLEQTLPEYRQLRQMAFEGKASAQFQSPLPLNKNQSPNVLRTYSTAAGGVGGALATGNPLLLLSPLLISPKAAGITIRAAASGAKAISSLAPVAEIAARGGTFQIGRELLSQPR